MLFESSFEPIGRRRIKKKRVIKSIRPSQVGLPSSSPTITTPIASVNIATESSSNAVKEVKPTANEIPIEKVERKTSTLKKESTTKLPSWNDLKDINIANDYKKEEEIIPEREGLTTNFTQEQLKNVWEKYSKLIYDQKKMLFNSLLTTLKYEVSDDSLIKVFLKNTVQQASFQSEKLEFIEFLRAEFKNPSVDFDFVILEEAEDANPEIAFTNKEKFHKLAESNPLLQEFKKRFDLDIDF